VSALDAQLRAIVRDLGYAAVPDEGDVRFGALPGWDSVTHLHLLLDIERQFEIEIPDAVGMSLDSIAKLHDYIVAQRPGLAGGGG
jgi:acyl carrier protein